MEKKSVVFPLEYTQHPLQVLTLLELPPEKMAALKMGTARIKKGDRVPPEGYSVHEQHEISLILKGKLEFEIAGKHGFTEAGEISVIYAGDEHFAWALEDTELIWFWFGSSS